MRNDGYKECKNCNALFYNKDNRFKYCSKDCSNIAKKENKRKYTKKWRENKKMENYNILKAIQELTGIIKTIAELQHQVVRAMSLLTEKIDSLIN